MLTHLYQKSGFWKPAAQCSPHRNTWPGQLETLTVKLNLLFCFFFKPAAKEREREGESLFPSSQIKTAPPQQAGTAAAKLQLKESMQVGVPDSWHEGESFKVGGWCLEGWGTGAGCGLGSGGTPGNTKKGTSAPAQLVISASDSASRELVWS